MEKQEIVIEFQQDPDGTWSSSTSYEINTCAIVALNMLQNNFKQINDALNKKAIEAGYTEWGKAPKDWIFEQRCTDILEGGE